MYLTENTQEALEMRENICNMLLSYEFSNAELGLQLIVGGGMHQDFIPSMWIYLVNQQEYFEDKKAYKKYVKILKSILNDDAKKLLDDAIKSKKDDYNFIFDGKFFKTIKDEKYELNLLAKDFAYAYMQIFELHLPVFFNEGILSLTEIIQFLDNRNFLSTFSFHNYSFDVIPKEINLFKNIQSLHFNKIMEVEDECYNPYITDISFSYLDDAISKMPLIKKLEKAFPNSIQSIYKSIANQLKSNSNRFQRRNEMDLAKINAEKAIYLYKKVKSEYRDASFYANILLAYINNKQYEMAVFCAKIIEKKYPLHYNHALYNVACAYSRLQNKEKVLEIMEKILYGTKNSYHINEFKEDNDFEYFWQDKDFLAVLDKYST